MGAILPDLRRGGTFPAVIIDAHHHHFLDPARIDYPFGWVPLADPLAAARALERYAAPGSRLRGIRHLIHDEPDPDWIAQPRVLESLALSRRVDSPSISARSRRATCPTCPRSPSASPISAEMKIACIDLGLRTIRKAKHEATHGNE